MPKQYDVILVGGGHNGLVAATCLARAGLRVHVVEEKPILGGATRTERPFRKAPALGISSGAYLVGLVQPELLAALDLRVPLLPRDPHYFLPTLGERYLLFGSDKPRQAQLMRAFFSDADVAADARMQAEIAALREDIGPTWMQAPLSIEETAARFVRKDLQATFVRLCRGSVGEYLDRFGFQSELIKGMYAVTDGFSGLDGTWDTPGTGMNFLVHNMCRLPQGGGAFMIVKGGLGAFVEALQQAASAAGVTFRTGTGVQRIEVSGGTASGVILATGEALTAQVVVVNADPFRMRELLPAGVFSTAYEDKLRGWRREGTTMKVNLALNGLPRFLSCPNESGVYGPTIHILPQRDDMIRALLDGYAEAKQGKLSAFPTIEWYIHSTLDPSLQDPSGRHNSALFVQWVPYQPKDGTWDSLRDGYVQHLLSLCDRFAPGFADLVEESFALAPPDIERHFGIRHGHIHHIDNAFGFADRHPYATEVAGLYSCSAGCHPAGSVIGSAGYLSAQRVLQDLGKSMPA